MRKILWIVVTVAMMMLFALPALADEAPDLTVMGEELAAADEFMRAEAYMDETADDGSIVVQYFLRSAYLVDVEASLAGMAESGKPEVFAKYYGDYARVYMLEYASLWGEDIVPRDVWYAVGVAEDGTMSKCATFEHIMSRTYDPNWCAGAQAELVLDRTLKQAMAE